MTNLFAAIPYIPFADDLVDIAFGRGSKAAGKFSVKIPKHIRIYKKERARLKVATEYITMRLQKIIKTFPSIDKLHPFFYELSSLLTDLGEVKQQLAKIQGSILVIQRLYSAATRKLYQNRSSDFKFGEVRRQTLGRIGSVTKKLSKPLIKLEKARKALQKMPSIDPRNPTIVVAGAPNTGKSTLVRAVSSAKPKIAYYPFTTKSLILGHITEEEPYPRMIQIVDTPGLLDRPITERNEIERQAITAIRYLATVIIFIIDPSNTCGVPVSEQLHLFENIQSTFPHVPYLLALNKIDLATPTQMTTITKALPSFTPFLINAKEKEGLTPLVETVSALTREVEAKSSGASELF